MRLIFTLMILWSFKQKCTARPYSFLVNDPTLASDNTLSFRHNLLETIQKAIMTTDKRIKNGKMLYDINREEAKISALSWGKTDKYEYHTGNDIFHSDQSIVNLHISCLRKCLKKSYQIKQDYITKWKIWMQWTFITYSIFQRYPTQYATS